MPTNSPILPPIESLLIPEAVDFNFTHNADQPFFTYAKGDSDDVTVITHLEFGRAAHRVAHAVRPDRTGLDGQVVAVIALADVVLYQAVTAGLITANLVPFPISPRNSPAAVVNLLQLTSCHRLLASVTTLHPLLDGIREHLAAHNPDYELLVEEIPTLDEVYPNLGAETVDDPFRRYPSPETRPSLDDKCLYLHSSGSTGFPKPILQTHRALIHWSMFPGLVEFRDNIPRLIMGCMALPAFHTLGVYMQLLNPLYGAVSIAVYPPTATEKHLLPVIPSPSNILEHTRRTKANSIIIIPTLLQIWAQSLDAVEFLKTLEYVGFSGGSLAPKLGNLLVESGVRLHPIYGGTEFAAVTYPLAVKGDEKDWQYMRFHDRASVRWAPQGDGTFELHLLTWEKHVLMIENLPDVKGYATSDLWERHPTKNHLWKIVGRIDDVIVHSSGEKTVPAPMEDIIMSSPNIQGAVMFGREHDQTGILLEPKPGHDIDVTVAKQLADFRNKMWPVIEEANRGAPGFSRIFKEMILVAAKEKPLPRTGKGTVMRKAALQLYDEEIKILYDTIETSTKASEAIVPPKTWTEPGVEEWLLKQAGGIHPGKDVSLTADLFEQGFDSLSATFLRHRIVGVLRSSEDAKFQKAAEKITQDTVYSYPSLKKLSSFIVGILSHPDSPRSAASDAQSEIEEMIKKYSQGLDHLQVNGLTPGNSRAESTVVLLTGSTGNLGSQILASLIANSRVAKVFAFNRASSGSLSLAERHTARFVDKGLDIALLESEKLVYISGDASQPLLGLDQVKYDELQSSVTTIIHNAWKLDFNLSVSSFEPHIRGTRHLIDFALSGPHASTTRLLFTSSVASAQSWDKTKGPFPEEVQTDSSVALGGGYGSSKYVAEHIIARSGLQASSLRIGQISGGLPTGAWSTTDWLPILVKSSLALGTLPKSEGVVSWLPMDTIATAVTDVAMAEGNLPLALNLVHPRPVKWNTVIEAIREALIMEMNLAPDALRLVPFSEWFELLEEKSVEGEQDLQRIPAVKLLGFFRAITHAELEIKHSGREGAESGGFANFSTEKMRKASPAISSARQLGAEDAARWVRYWAAAGFLV